MKRFTLEIAVFTLQGAMVVQEAGAGRIEFCENPYDGGTTPSYGNLKAVRRLVSIPAFPIIRPRGGDFCYNDAEIEAMQQDIKLCRELGFEGVVTGLLNADGTIDRINTARLVELAYPMEVTFHRAFDRCINPLESLEEVIGAGCQRILTSGQFPTAPEATGLIRQLVDKAADRIIIMPGSGVNSHNIESLALQTGAAEFHASARIAHHGDMKFRVDTMNEDLHFMSVNAPEVAAMKQVLAGLSV